MMVVHEHVLGGCVWQVLIDVITNTEATSDLFRKAFKVHRVENVRVAAGGGGG